VIPANAYPGWSVTVDGGPPQPTVETDGFVSLPAQPGVHTYEFVYTAPRLLLIVALGVVPWLILVLLLARRLGLGAPQRAGLRSTPRIVERKIASESVELTSRS
jgi:hypothetical protein